MKLSEHILAATRSPKFIERFWQRVDTTGECWLWTGGTYRTGYGRVCVQTEGGKQDGARAHRVSFAIANDKLPHEMLVCHKCDVRLCVNPAHLFLGSGRDNMSDCAGKNRIAWGEKLARSNLTEVDVREIRRRGQFETGTAIAKDYKLNAATVRYIISRKYWARVE